MATITVKTNLRCAACVATIRPVFDAEPGITSWNADVANPEKLLSVEGPTITRQRVEELLVSKGYSVAAPSRSLGMVGDAPAVPVPVSPTAASYYPLVLISVYLVAGVLLLESALPAFEWSRVMRHFMAGFFLVFSFFKLLDVRAFADAYRGYDLLAKAVPAYGFVYPFLELSLGAAYLANFQPVYTNLATILIMGLGTVGVVQTIRAKRVIRCACLGTVFNLPMSTVTLVEDLLMVVMAIAMLLMEVV